MRKEILVLLLLAGLVFAIDPSGSEKSLALQVMKQDGFESQIGVYAWRANSTHFAVSYWLNDSFKAEVNGCLAQGGASRTTCLSDLRDRYFSNLDASSFSISVGNITTYKIENMTAGLSTKTATINLVNGGIFYIATDGRAGEKFRIGYGTIELATVESTGAVGMHTEIAYDSSGFSHVVHRDATNGYVRYCNDTIDHVWKCAAIAGTSGGNHPNIAIDSAGVVWVSFMYYSGAGDLKVCNNSAAPTTWTCGNVETANSVGWYSSIAVDTNDKVHIVHYDNTNYDLRYCNNTAAPTTWSCGTIDSVGKVGKYSSIAIGPDNVIHVSETAVDNVTYCNNSAAPTTWSCTRIGSTGNGGDTAGLTANSIAVNSTGGLGIAYFNYTASDLWYCYNTSTTAWACSALDTGGDVGEKPSLAFDAVGFAHITYQDVTNIKQKYCNNSLDWVWKCGDIASTGADDQGSGFGRQVAIREGRLSDSDVYSSNVSAVFYNATTADLIYANLVGYGQQEAAAYNPFFNVSWNYPASNVWNTTTQNIKHYFTPLVYDNTIDSVSLWTNKTGAFTQAVANSSAVTNNTIGYLQYNYGADYELVFAYFNITNSTGDSNLTANFSIKIDTADPVTSADAGEYVFGEWSVSSPVTVTLSCEDTTSGCLITKYCTDTEDSCTPNTEYTEPVEISDEGTTYIRFNSTDNAGRIEAVSSEEVDIDTDAPVTSADAGAYTFGTWSTSSPVTVELSCEDSVSGCASTKYCTDAEDSCTPDTEYSEPFEISTVGVSYVRFNSTDAAGNAEGINSETVEIDTVDPVTTASPVDEWSNVYTFTTWTKSSYIDVSLSCVDATSGCLVTKYCTGVPNTCTPSTTYATAVHITTEGTSYIRYNSTDVATNTETIKSGAVMIDTADPSTDATAENDDESEYTFNVWSKTSYVDVTMTCSDDTSGCAVTKYCADSVNTCTPSTTVLAPARISTDGTSYIRYNSTDNAGNIETILSQILKIDDNAPVTTATAINNDSSAYTFGEWTTSLQVYVTLGCADTGGSGCFVTYYCNDTANTCTPATEWTEAVEISYEGISYFRFNSTDSVGNIGAIESEAIYIDPDYVSTTETYGVMASSLESKIGLELTSLFGSGSYCFGGVGEDCVGGTSLDMGNVIMAVFVLGFIFIWASVSGIAWNGVFFLLFLTLAILSTPQTGFLGTTGWSLTTFIFAILVLAVFYQAILRRG